MENHEIAAILNEVADLLELQDANPFRVRAYRNAARTVGEHATPLRTLVEQGEDLTGLPGIGKDMDRHIRELLATGTLEQRERLSAEVPSTLVQITRLPGVGPRRTRQLWEELGVETVDDLEAAAEADRIVALDGFGEKTQERILSGIEQYRRHTSRFSLVRADRFLVPLLRHLRQAPEVQRLEVAGSYRRRRETVGDIDLLAVAEDGKAVMERFTSYGGVARVEMEGETRGAVVLSSDVEVDLRIVSPESYGAALVYFTGSKAHNVKLRQRALRRGLTVSEYGVFEVGEDEETEIGGEADTGAPGSADGDGAPGAGSPEAGPRVAGATEEEVYGAVGLPWIPPEIREDRGEIEAAERGDLPELITLEDIRGDLQMHTTWSDGRDGVEEMLEACVARGYEYFAITDHSQALAMTGGLDEERLAEQLEEIEAVAARHPEIRFLRSLEVDILADGSLDLGDEALEALDVVVASVHSRFQLPADEQTGRILAALRHPEVDILAHPTGRIINRRDPYALDLEAVLRCCAEEGVAVELNASPDRLDLRDTHLIRARELGVGIVINTDAHRAAHLDFMRYGVEQARRAWLTAEHVWNARPREDFLAALR